MWKAASGEAAPAAEEGRPGIMRGVFGVGLGTARGWGGRVPKGASAFVNAVVNVTGQNGKRQRDLPFPPCIVPCLELEMGF